MLKEAQTKSSTNQNSQESEPKAKDNEEKPTYTSTAAKNQQLNTKNSP